MKESDILYEAGRFWVLCKGPGLYLVMESGTTHSTAVATFHFREKATMALTRAIAEANRRAAEATSLFERGRKLGKAAFEAGKPATPAMDNFLRAELKGLRVGLGRELLEGWTRGWSEANAATPVTPQE